MRGQGVERLGNFDKVCVVVASFLSISEFAATGQIKVLQPYLPHQSQSAARNRCDIALPVYVTHQAFAWASRRGAVAAYCNEMRDPSGLRPGPPHQTALHSMSLQMPSCWHSADCYTRFHPARQPNFFDIFLLYVYIFLLLRDESVHLIYLKLVLHPGRRGNSRVCCPLLVACRPS